MTQGTADKAPYFQLRGKRLIAAFLTLLLTAASLVGVSERAHAALPEGIRYINVDLGGEEYDGTTVITAGDTLTFEIGYNADVGAGTTVDVDLPEALLDISDDFAAEVSQNDAIDSVELVDGVVRITFTDPWPSGVHEGTFAISTTIKQVEESGYGELEWSIGEEETSVEVIIKKPGDEFENVSDGSRKSGNADLSKYVTIEDGVLSLDPAILDQEITYEVALDTTEDLNNLVISDEIDELLAYVESSFQAEITQWEPNGLNKSTQDFPVTPRISGNTFEITADILGPSQLRITYTAKLAGEGARADLEAALQAELDELVASDEHGNFGVELTNRADFGERTDSSTIWIGGTIQAPAKPNPGAGFSKSADWTEQVYAPDALNEDGEFIDPPVVTYTLTTDFDTIAAEFEKGDGESLEGDILIREQLRGQADGHAEWALGEGFLTAGDVELNQIDDCADLAGFANSSEAGEYCVDGDVVWINVGPNAEAGFAEVQIKSNLLKPEAMHDDGAGTVEGSQKYRFDNLATFHWSTDGEDYSTSDQGHQGRLVINPDKGDEGHRDEGKFSKSGPADTIQVEQGETTEVDYTFTVAEGAVPDVSKSTIVDYVDWEVFERGAYQISGQYAYWIGLHGDDFDVVENADGNLEISLSAAGIDKIDEHGFDKRLVVTLTLTTLPFDGKETKEMTNKAILFGEDGDAEYNSETSSESTSFGREAEVRKRVFERDDAEWVETLKAQVDENGDLIQDVYVYRVEWIPRGGYAPGQISDVSDFLPDAVEFLGFVTEEDAATAENPTKDPVDVGGNVIASFEEDRNLVVLKQGENNYTPGAVPTAYFAVQVLDAEEPIENVIGTTRAIIEPTPGPSIDIEKWTDEDGSSGPDYDPEGKLTNDGYVGDFDDESKELTAGVEQQINFTISNDGGEALIDLTVTDATTGGTSGEIQDLVCTFPDESTGVEWDGPFEPGTQFKCVGTLPGLEAGQTHTNTATIVGTGIESGTEVTDEDPWNGHVKSYAIGDYVWVDSDRDGIQGEDEDPLAEVTVELYNENDELIGTTATDAEGRYLFDNLPAGSYKVKFTLTEEQATIYTFTSPNAGDDTGVDSNADPVTGWTEVFVLDDSNEALTNDYDRELGATEGVDPTWDAGVILKAVSVGDYVWVDENRDGIQDEGEPGIPGVTLCLVGPDGEPVTDVFGDPVGPVVTDENGYYSFENLPALSGDETYTVCIDREASEEALKPYAPTKEHQGDDRGQDSSTWEASTEPGDLHNDGDRDPTLDFGFVTKSYAIGDYVWIDSNGDGVQGEDEDPLEGVTVELYDSEGELIASTTTDEHGRYLFDNLPAGSYKVKFTLTEEQAAIYEFTTLNTGNDESSNDSDADPATGWTQEIVLGDSNDALTLEYDRELGATEGIDPTWDAGVILKQVAPDETPGPDDLPALGAEINGPLIGLAALLLLAGAATIGLVRRQS